LAGGATGEVVAALMRELHSRSGVLRKLSGEL
jgi:hypothetical protein